MTKPASYPFLAIARKYGLDYGDVLLLADYWKRGCRVEDRTERTMSALHNALLWPHEALGVITFANADFRAIQAGLIDWQTGEPNLTRPLRTPLLDAETLKPIPGTGALNYALFDASLDAGTNDMSETVPSPAEFQDQFACAKCGQIHATFYPNGAKMFADDCTMLDDKGNRSIFDDVDEGYEAGEHQEVIDALNYRNSDDE